MNVSVNDIASFTCSASNALMIFWEVNNATINKIPGLDEQQYCMMNGSASTSIIWMPLGQDLDFALLNNSNITCFCYKLKNGVVESSDDSTPALLRIQG